MQLSEAKQAWRALAPQCEREFADDSMRLAQCRHVTARHADGMIPEIDAVWRVCSFEEEDARRLGKLWPLIDGTRTIAQLAERFPGEGTQTRDLLLSLYEHGLLLNAGGTAVPALSFHDHATSVGRMWLSQLVSKSGLAQVLWGPGMTRRLMIGWLLDRYHYISGAASHVSRAIAHVSSERLTMMLSEHLSEEYWHGTWMASGLRAVGITEEELQRSLPLPATLGAMNFLRWIAETDTLGYFLTLGVREAHAAERAEQQRERWKVWDQAKLLPMEAYAPFRDHDAVDLEAGHSSISAEPFVGMPPLAQAQQESLFRTLKSFAAATAESAAGVLRYYTDEKNPMLFLSSLD
jgi:hypothetical protein